MRALCGRSAPQLCRPFRPRHAGHDRLSPRQCADLHSGLSASDLRIGFLRQSRRQPAAAWRRDLAHRRCGSDRAPHQDPAGLDVPGHHDARADPGHRAGRLVPRRHAAAGERADVPVPARPVLGTAGRRVPVPSRENDSDRAPRPASGLAQSHRRNHCRLAVLFRRQVPHRPQCLRQRLFDDVHACLHPDRVSA